MRKQASESLEVTGAEDITIHPETGTAFISAHDRSALQAGRPSRGALYRYELNAEDPQLINLTESFDPGFNPHGISLYIRNGMTRLFVINHQMNSEKVELFDYRKGKLIHVDTVQGDLMHSPNDLLAVGPNSFYVSNDHGSKTALGRTLEDYLRMSRSNVLYYDGRDFSLAAKRIGYANGINMSADGRTLYVASTTRRKIRVFSRHKQSGKLSFEYDIGVKTGADNIEMDKQNRLWVGAHPKLLTFSKHAADPTLLSPSQILIITIQGNKSYRVEEFWLDSGESLSGASVATVYGRSLLIGSVFDDHLLICQP